MSWSKQLSALLLADADLPGQRLLERVLSDAPSLESEAGLLDVELAVVKANLEGFACLLARDAGAEIEVPWVSVEHARRQARAGVDVAEVLRGYRLGHAWLFEQLAACASDHVSDSSSLAAAVAQIGVMSFHYVDAVCARVAAEHRDELDAIARGELSRQTSVIRALLAGARIGTLDAERSLGYRLDGPHVSLLVWRASRDQPAPPGFSLQGVAEEVATALEARSRLWTTEGQDLLAGWITVPGDERAANLQRLAEMLASGPAIVAVSRRERGASGFREARRQADRARAVVLAGSGADAGRLVRYDDIALVSLLAHDSEAAAAFVAHELHGLARNDSIGATLRRTLLAFVRIGAIAETAEAMSVHRNTVAQRLRRAESLIGHPLSARRMEIEAALLLCEWLGTHVLAD